MNKTILLINGPNLNLLGTRQPEIYGHETLEDIETACKAHAERAGFTLDPFQSNSEGAIIDAIHGALGKYAAIIINPGAYSHTSIAILDALKGVDIPVYEIHLSNIHAREEFRHHSFVSKVAKGLICGLGSQGYLAAIDAIAAEHSA